MNIKVVTTPSDNKSSTFKVNLNKQKCVVSNQLKKDIKDISVNDYVKHVEENLYGKVTFANNKKIAVLWNDNTRERFSLEDAINELEYASSSDKSCVDKNYIDDVQTIVAPTTPQISKDSELNTDDLNTKSLNDLNDKEVTSINMEELKMQNKINKLEKELANKKVNNVKERAANELVALAIEKEFIDKDEADITLMQIMQLNDEEYEDYKNKVIAFKLDGEVTSESDYEGLTEEERTIKSIISKHKTNFDYNSVDLDETSARGLEKQAKVSFDNFNGAENFTDKFSDSALLNLEQSLNNLQNKSINNSNTTKKTVRRQDSSSNIHSNIASNTASNNFYKEANIKTSNTSNTIPKNFNPVISGINSNISTGYNWKDSLSKIEWSKK